MKSRGILVLLSALPAQARRPFFRNYLTSTSLKVLRGTKPSQWLMIFLKKWVSKILSIFYLQLVFPLHLYGCAHFNIARALSKSKDLCVVDEFTSVVDRTVAQIGSHAIAKTVRGMGKKFIAASCHYDIEEWLQPDWVYKPHENIFHWRRLRQRPRIVLEIVKVHRSAWELFRQYHYLTQAMPKVAQCFMAFWKEVPVAFYSYIHFQNNRLKHTKRACRVVCLPDYQGVGIGMKLEEHIVSCLVALGWDYIGASSHPARMAYCCKSDNWLMIRKPKVSTNHAGTSGRNAVKYLGRMVATFRYVGPPARVDDARALVGDG